MMASSVLAALVLLPLLIGLACLRLGAARSDLSLRISVGGALALVLVDSIAVRDVAVPLVAGRAIELSSVAQLGIQLLGLALLGFLLSLSPEAPSRVAAWLPVAWASVTGLIFSLLIASLPLALLCFLASALIWAFGLSSEERALASGVVIRFAALLSLAMPLLLIAFRLAEERSTSSDEIERIVLALLVPAFGLVLGLIPMHAWALTLAGGTPRAMVFGVISLAQTTGFVLLLRTLATYPWMTGVARDALVVGGGLSACVGGWMALSARRDDPDDWLVYAAVANGGMLLTGLGTQSKAAGAGVALLLFARVLALVVLELAPRVSTGLRRLANAAGTLALAGTPGLAGFPGLWLILRSLPQTESVVANLSLLAGSGFLFATAIRRWRAEARADHHRLGWATAEDPGARRAVISLLVLLVLLGLAPQIIAPAFEDALRDIFFPHP